MFFLILRNLNFFYSYKKRELLPPGTGIVTRRPLILQLLTYHSEYAELLNENENFFDFESVCKKIEDENDRLSGSNKEISSVPINLKIYSPHG